MSIFIYEALCPGGEVEEVAWAFGFQKLWQDRSWGALAGEHKHKQRQTPCYLLRSNLIGFKGDEIAATEDARRTGEENKWTATKWILNDWLRNAKNKGVRDKKLHLCIRLTNRLLYPCFYVFWSCDEKDEDRFSFYFNLFISSKCIKISSMLESDLCLARINLLSIVQKHFPFSLLKLPSIKDLNSLTCNLDV